MEKDEITELMRVKKQRAVSTRYLYGINIILNTLQYKRAYRQKSKQTFGHKKKIYI
jgi:hypothetical protein